VIPSSILLLQAESDRTCASSRSAPDILRPIRINWLWIGIKVISYFARRDSVKKPDTFISYATRKIIAISNPVQVVPCTMMPKHWC